jgi:hypothetical protein
MAQDEGWSDFATLLRTPGGMQRALEHCDGHPDFETDFASWLETAQLDSAEERRAVRRASLQLLEDTTDRQVALALIDGLLRHALEDVKSGQAVIPQRLARSLYWEITKAAKNRAWKARAIAEPAYGLAEDGSIVEQSQIQFAEAFLNLVDPRAPHHIQPAKVEPAIRAVRSVSRAPIIPPDEPASLPAAGRLSHLLLLIAAIWLIAHVLRGRRAA